MQCDTPITETMPGAAAEGSHERAGTRYREALEAQARRHIRLGGLYTNTAARREALSSFRPSFLSGDGSAARPAPSKKTLQAPEGHRDHQGDPKARNPPGP